jgi:hypothetical protein
MKSKATLYPIAVALIILFLSGCSSLKVREASVEIEGEETSVKIVFSDRDKEVIREYYSDQDYGKKKKHKKKHKKTPPGLAKKDKLPPGLQKRLDRGQPLPPGLQGRGLASDLEEKLTPLPEGYIYVQIGVEIVIKNVKTEVVMDVVYVDGERQEGDEDSEDD